jgi:hypothetical protein
MVVLLGWQAGRSLPCCLRFCFDSSLVILMIGEQLSIHHSFCAIRSSYMFLLPLLAGQLLKVPVRRKIATWS